MVNGSICWVRPNFIESIGDSRASDRIMEKYKYAGICISDKPRIFHIVYDNRSRDNPRAIIAQNLEIKYFSKLYKYFN